MPFIWVGTSILHGHQCQANLAARSSWLHCKGSSSLLSYFKALSIELVMVFNAILTSRQTRERLQCLYENLMSNNFGKTAVVKRISIVN